MAIYPIRKIGDPVLRTKAKELKEVTDQTRKLIKDMFETMYDAPGVGLAAPQIGISQRIIVVDVDDEPYAVINPVIVENKGKQIGEEACLSVPGERGDVERALYVKVKGLDPQGKEIEVVAFDFLARAFQHEIDHLEGTLFVDKVYRGK